MAIGDRLSCAPLCTERDIISAREQTIWAGMGHGNANALFVLKVNMARNRLLFRRRLAAGTMRPVAAFPTCTESRECSYAEHAAERRCLEPSGAATGRLGGGAFRATGKPG